MLAPCCKAVDHASGDGDGGTFAVAAVEDAAPLVQNLGSLVCSLKEDGDSEEEEVHHGA